MGDSDHGDTLTPREREVLRLATSGLTNNEIARELGITRNAVRFHLKEIHSKLGTGGERTTLAGWQRGLGLLPFPLAKLGTAAAVTAASVMLAGGGYLAFRERPRDAFAAPERFEGAAVVDGIRGASTPASTPPTAPYEVWSATVFGRAPGGAVVPRRETMVAGPVGTGDGICASVTFSVRGADPGQFRLLLDHQDVTSSAAWVSLNRIRGELCYAPLAGLDLGDHSVEFIRDEAWGGVLKATYEFTVTP